MMTMVQVRDCKDTMKFYGNCCVSTATRSPSVHTTAQAIINDCHDGGCVIDTRDVGGVRT